MRKVHRNILEGRRSYWTNPSKFDGVKNTETMAERMVTEGDLLRRKLQGHRILLDLRTGNERDLKNAFRL